MTDEMGIEASTSFTTMYIHPAPQVAVLTLMRKTGAIGRFWHHRTGAVQDPASGLRRIFFYTPLCRCGPTASLTRLSSSKKTASWALVLTWNSISESSFLPLRVDAG